MTDLLIDQEFRSLIPPLSPEELDGLEQSLIAEGNRIPIDTWNGYIVDGHHRYDICQKRRIPLKPANELKFKDRDDVLVWIIRNQFGRRNLNNYQRSALALKLEELKAKQAKERQGTRTDLGNIQQNSAGSYGETRQELARIAHVSHDTLAKVKKIVAEGTESQKSRLARGETTINRVYNQIRRDKSEWERPPITEECKTNITLLMGDMANIVPTLEPFDLILADPPYNRTRWEWDSFEHTDYLAQTKTWLSLCKQALKPSYHLFWFCSPHFGKSVV